MAPALISESRGHSPTSNGFPQEGHGAVVGASENGHGNGSNGHGHGVQPVADTETYDLVCVGFGPASLAIAIALEELQGGLGQAKPKVRFVEKQQQFRWHGGMLLPGTKMQISFIKDLVSQRNPCSYYSFLNYLKLHDRLVQFSNLDTFLPSRVEFADYLAWAASHFSQAVSFGEEAQEVVPVHVSDGTVYDWLEVRSRDTQTGEIRVRRSKKVLIAAGGKPRIPAAFPSGHARVLHSSEYNYRIGQTLPVADGPYTVAVVGGGQSAAEVFTDLQRRFSNASTRLILRDTALRPSDDSPFVNEIFNPEAVDHFYAQPKEARTRRLIKDRATNYSVVRLGLIERIYEQQYMQGFAQPDKSKWQHQILTASEVVDVTESADRKKLELRLRSLDASEEGRQTRLVVDAVVLGTGYVRNVHVDLLRACQSINASKEGEWQVGRDYSLPLKRSQVGPDVGVWLQGSNEHTHGLSDSLLSVLATRSGEMVQAIFGANKA